MDFKNINGLMRHLRENNNIQIAGSTQKRQLQNIGYFHGEDYVILICYYLKLLKVSRTEIKSFIKEYKKITDNYKDSLKNQNVINLVIHPDYNKKMCLLEKYI